MPRLKLAIWMTAAALFVARSVCAAPMTCQIDVQSTEGGRLEVVTMDANPKLPIGFPSLVIVWHPPASGTSVDLNVEYRGSPLERLGAPTVAFARFKSSDADFNTQYKAVVSAGGAQSWRIEPTDIHAWPHQGDILFIEGKESSNAMNAAVENGKSIQIVIMQSDQPVLSETFDTSATAGRDQLLASARHLIEISDPSVCRW